MRTVKVVTTTVEETVGGKKTSTTTTVTSVCTNDANAEAVLKEATKEHDDIRKRVHERMDAFHKQFDGFFSDLFK